MARLATAKVKAMAHKEPCNLVLPQIKLGHSMSDSE
jgi:hypothetical protein